MDKVQGAQGTKVDEGEPGRNVPLGTRRKARHPGHQRRMGADRPEGTGEVSEDPRPGHVGVPTAPLTTEEGLQGRRGSWGERREWDVV